MTGVSVNEALEQHLLFHKALISEDVESGKIDRYLEILSENPDCERLQDPVDESIRTVFRLVTEQNLDPWAIDLKEFTRIYTEKVSSDSRVNIIVAGKLILMAWKVLRMQSGATKDRSMYEPVYEEAEEVFDDEFGQSLFIPDFSPRETYGRTSTREVTVMEILGAFDEAREEIRQSEERERVRKLLKEKEAAELKVFDNKAHKEVSESDVEEVWERIQRIGTGSFPITDLFVANVDDNITVFMAALQLVRDGKLSIWQDELPYGDIMMEIKVDWTSGRIEDAADIGVKVPEAVM